MDPDRAARFVEALGKPLEEVTFRELFVSMTRQYATERVDAAVALEDDGDMLLFQWGDYDGKATIDITRQLIFEDGDIFQLSAKIEGAPLSGVKAGNRWCATPEELAELIAFVEASEAFRLLGDTRGARVTYDQQ